MKGTELQVFDTMKQAKCRLQTLEEGKVSMYACGITVYDLCHVGHARQQVAFDVIQRTLRALGYDVTYVRNFTDVDDKIIKRAREEGIDWKELTERNIAYFYRDMDALGIQRPEHEPKVSEHIDDIIESIEQIIANGHGYEVEGDVYFSVESCPSYGALSGRKLEDMEAGARVEVNERKRNPMDFALWKGAKPGEPHWPSPWGQGRPGWHIECSVMSTLYLGPDFDIHGGGRDLIFPHHENERAQAIAHRPNSQFARYWMHNGLVRIGDEKMSKSLNNFMTIRDVLAHYSGEEIRTFIIGSHYRSPLNYTTEALVAARTALRRFYTALRGRPVRAGLPRGRDRPQRRRPERHGLQPLRRDALLRGQLSVQGSPLQLLPLRGLRHAELEDDAQPRRQRA